MLYYCNRCKTAIEIPDLPDEQRNKILVLVAEQQQLLAIKTLREYTHCDLAKAKALVMHLNPVGHCHRCKFDALEGECTNCPKCGAFNLNWALSSSSADDFHSKPDSV